jgi:biofilm PGA synthesis protein PgaA
MHQQSRCHSLKTEMKMRAILALACVLIIGWPRAGIPATAEISHIRAGDHPGFTRDQQGIVAERVRNLVRDGKYTQALSALSPFTSEPTKYPILFSDYLVILFWDGKPEEMIRRFEALPASFPKRAYLLRNVAKAYYDKGAFLKAASAYQEALEQTPSDSEAQKGLVLSLMQAGDLERALDSVSEFVGRSPDSLPLFLLKAELLMKMHRYGEAFTLCHLVEAKKDMDLEQIFKLRDDFITALPIEEQQAILNGLNTAAQQGDSMAKLDQILLLVLTKDYAGAVHAFETADVGLDRYPHHLLCWVAWAYFKTGKTEKAMALYQRLLAADPEYVKAKIGLAYCLSTSGDSAKALQILDTLLSANPENLEIRFARAFVYEQTRHFWPAVEEYDRILEIQPANPVARRLRLIALSDLGASSYALEEAARELPSDSDIYNTLIGDMAVHSIRWKEPKEAIKSLVPLVQNGDFLRAKFDYVVALTEDNRMEEAVDFYEKLINDGISPPPWVLERAAEAYFYLEQPTQALALYNDALKSQPNSFDGRMGKFYTLQELREWDEAERLLDELDKQTPPFIGEGRSTQPNWNKLEIVLAKGWFLAYEDRLEEAEQFFEDLYEKAPAHAGIRSGLAHVYFFRGWPRKALREFEIIKTLEPEYYKAEIGRISVLNALAAKEQAREEADNLLALHPKDKDVQQLVRQLRVEEMRELATDVSVAREEDGTEDVRLEAKVFEPLSLYSRMYGFVLWQRTSDDNQSSRFQRAGIGLDHIFNRTFDLRQQFSVDYEEGDDFGSLTLIHVHPDDYLDLSLSYDSFSTDIPIRARVFGIEADSMQFGITYRESEWRSYHFSLSRQAFSDENDRDQASVGYEQGLWTNRDWKMRLFLDGYMSRNSRDDAPYFNPEKDGSLSVTHMTEHTVWRIYNSIFMHRLFLTAGSYKQKGFSNAFIGSIRYEQDHEFSDTQALLWGVVLFRNVYDGDSVDGYSFDLNYRVRF